MFGIIIGILLFGGIILGILKFASDKMKKIIENNPKQRFKYLDTFYHYIKTKDNDGNDSKHYVYYTIIMDENTNQVYAVKLPYFRNASYMSLGTQLHFNKQKVGVKSKPIQFYEKGSFWIDETFVNIYK